MNNIFNPYQTPYQMPFSGAQKQEVVHVNGRPGAEAYTLPPNSSILMLDESEPIVWLKTTDGAGYGRVMPYSITPYQPKPEVDLSALEERISKIEEALKDGKPDASSNKKSK